MHLDSASLIRLSTFRSVDINFTVKNMLFLLKYMYYDIYGNKKLGKIKICI